MGEFKVNLTARNPKKRRRATPPIEAAVDTGAYWSCLPRRLLLDAGIKPEGKKRFATATDQIAERDYGYAILEAEGRATIAEVLFGEASDHPLLGVMTIEGFCVMVDNVNQRFVDIEAKSPSFFMADEV